MSRPSIVLLLLAGTAALAFLQGSASARGRQSQDVLTSLATEKGKCVALVTLQDDKTASCVGTLANTTWKSGRAGFYFMTTAHEAITFSGNGEGQIHPNPDIAIQPIDLIIFGSTHETQKAVGSCSFSNPFHGKATVDCEAVTEVGTFKGSFVTDGSDPTIKRF